jgi:hypothetical protein
MLTSARPGAVRAVAALTIADAVPATQAPGVAGGRTVDVGDSTGNTRMVITYPYPKLINFFPIILIVFVYLFLEHHSCSNL